MIQGEHDALPVVHWPALTPSPRGLVTDVGICPPEQNAAQVIEVSAPEHTEGEGLSEALAHLHTTDPFSEKRVSPVDAIVTSPPILPPELPQKQQHRKAPLALGIVLASVLVFVVILVLPRTSRPPDQPRPEPTYPTGEEMKLRLKDLIERRAPASDFERIGQEALRYGYCQIARTPSRKQIRGRVPEASWQLARFYDPRVTDNVYRNCAQPNIRWAISYYNMGARKGSDRHRNELRALCSQNPRAGAGDEGLLQICR